MKHLILGAGNLGLDLLLELNAQHKGDIKMFSASRGVDFRKTEELGQLVESYGPDVIWCSVGGGSVAEARIGSPTHGDSTCLNLGLPVFLALKKRPETLLVLFSTDYAADQTRPTATYAQCAKELSNYAWQKKTMEKEVIDKGFPNVAIIRVGSLYGVHKPERTFPGKMLKNFAFAEGKIRLPANIVVPTPTRWLAGRLVSELDKISQDVALSPAVFHLAPAGGVTVKDWAKFVLGEFRKEEDFCRGEDYFDNERPMFSGLGSSFGPEAHWYELFQNYYRKEWFMKGLSPSI